MSKPAIKEKEKSFQDRLKQFFKLNKTQDKSGGGKKVVEEFSLTAELETEIGPDSPLQQRLKMIKDMCEIVQRKRLEEYAPEKLWNLLSDLVKPESAKEHRQLVLHFFSCLVQGQADRLHFMRMFFFTVVKKHTIPEDIVPRFELLCTLTANGRDISYFEEEFGPFMTKWMPEVIAAGKTLDFMSILLTAIKYNATYLDPSVITGFFEHISVVVCRSSSEKEVLTCLQVMDAIVCYSTLPTLSVPLFIETLCYTINSNTYCKPSWKIMRNLLGTHLGHTCLCLLCRMLESPANLPNASLLRGAAFYVGMSLWSSERVQALKHTPMMTLPSLLQALRSNNNIVAFEVMLCITRLVDAAASDLTEPGWDYVLEIVRTIFTNLEKQRKNGTINETSYNQFTKPVHDVLSKMESLYESMQYNAPSDKLFALVDYCAALRPEASVLRLLSYRAASLRPAQTDWMKQMRDILDRYYKQETRTNIRVNTLDILGDVCRRHYYIYGDDLLENIVVPMLQNVDSDPDVLVRNAAVQLLVDLCLDGHNKRHSDLLDILERVLMKPFELYTSDKPTTLGDTEVLDIKSVVNGLIKIFRKKLYELPSMYAIRAYSLLASYLDAHYSKPIVFENASALRYLIFECLLQIRANTNLKLGFPENKTNGEVRYSTYVTLDYLHNPSEQLASPPDPVPTAVVEGDMTKLSLTQACKAVVTCLSSECDWSVLQLVLKELPEVMQNQALILPRYGRHVDMLVTALCRLVHEKSLPDILNNTPPKFTRSEFHAHVFPSVVALIPYRKYLDSAHQQKIIKCLQAGLISKCPQLCIEGLMLCALEMKDAMYKLIPDVLLSLSKIMSTVVVAIPMLEFLSMLIRLPNMYTSFVQDQYMAIFAIALPFTNPSKFNHYIVSLAHHVIAIWFLKCRLPYRKDFVPFITRGLKSNILLPFEEGTRHELVNEDSSNRKRSASLTEQTNRKRERPISGQLGGRVVDLKLPIDDTSIAFHLELTETCNDLMARYVCSNWPAMSKRSSMASTFFKDALSGTWLVRNKVITISVSGSGQKPHRDGFCEECWLKFIGSQNEVSATEQELTPTRRRHKSAIQRSVSIESPPAGPRTKDDLHMHKLPLKMQSLEDSSVDDVRRSHASETDANKEFCPCWCNAWVEVFIRRPTGDAYFMMRLENFYFNASYTPTDFPLLEMTNYYFPWIYGKKNQVLGLSAEEKESEKQATSCSSQTISSEEDADTRMHVQAQRSNSVPEIGADVKLRFAQEGGVIEETPEDDVTSSSKPFSPPPTSHQRSEQTVRTAKHMPARAASKAKESDKNSSPVHTTADLQSVQQDPANLPPLSYKRDRGHTISVMSPVKREHQKRNVQPQEPQKEVPEGLTPSYVFLILYQSGYIGSPEDRPIRVDPTHECDIALRNLDRIPAHETHKIGVLYIGKGQVNSEIAILRNECGSLRYMDFLQGLGTLIRLEETDPKTTYIGGLNQNGDDGKFAYSWHDNVMQVIFHVPTLMPNRETDPSCNSKKLHIGNDYVNIVYNDSGEEFNIHTIRGQFNFACVMIRPLDHGMNHISVKVKPDLAVHFPQGDGLTVSDMNLPILARQLALHANLAAMIYRSVQGGGQDPYASNWLERLRQIKRLAAKARHQEEMRMAAENYVMEGATPETQASSALKRPTFIDDFSSYI